MATVRVVRIIELMTEFNADDVLIERAKADDQAALRELKTLADRALPKEIEEALLVDPRVAPVELWISVEVGENQERVLIDE